MIMYYILIIWESSVETIWNYYIDPSPTCRDMNSSKTQAAPIRYLPFGDGSISLKPAHGQPQHCGKPLVYVHIWLFWLQPNHKPIIWGLKFHPFSKWWWLGDGINGIELTTLSIGHTMFLPIKGWNPERQVEVESETTSHILSHDPRWSDGMQHPGI